MLDLYESLAERLRCPKELLRVLKKIIPAEAAPLLLFASNGSVTLPMVASRFNLTLADAASKLEKLFCDGLMAKEPASAQGTAPQSYDGHEARVMSPEESPGRNRPSYRTRSFYQIVNLLLGEGRLQPEHLPDQLSQEELEQLRDFYMEARLQIYDKYLVEKRIPTSSQVITLDEAITPKAASVYGKTPDDISRFHRHPHEGITRVTPASQAAALLRRQGRLALIPCSCRLTFQRCDQPLETCINMGDSAEELLARGVGREITQKEAVEILGIANSRGLVHMAIYAPGMDAYALCSCCECCCHDLQAFKQHGRTNWIAKADVIAEDDPGACTNCGRCVKRCVFGARELLSQDRRLIRYDPSLCYGCGLCVTTCPARAIKMAPRHGKP
ncbi:MAG: ATP-binding protein [Syntrophothermus sp.]